MEVADVRRFKVQRETILQVAKHAGQRMNQRGIPRLAKHVMATEA
jgi:hypothetical protein